MRIDLHCHTEASPDCITPLALIADRCRQQGIDVLAITDHNLIKGAVQLRQMVSESEDPEIRKINIIIGEEISTNQGELIGLFLEEKVPFDLSPEETVREVHEQGGLVLLPHGFDPLKRWRLQPEARFRIREKIDIVETFNTRVSREIWNEAAANWARENDRIMSAGSDAHTLADIGTAFVKSPVHGVSTPEDLLNALAAGEPQGIWTHPVLAYVFKQWDRLKRRLAA